MNTAKEILTTARKLISDENNWTQGAYARNIAGDSVLYNDPTAICFCSIGALERVNKGSRDPIVIAYRALATELGGGSNIVQFNDKATHQEVLALFDRVIANCP